MTQIPTDRKDTFTYKLRILLAEQGWYFNSGWREHSDRDRGHRRGLSEGDVVDELIRRDWKEHADSNS